MDVFLNLLTSHKRITEAILGSYFDYFSNIFVDACNAPGITLEDQSATLPAAESYSFADGFETKIGRQNFRPLGLWAGGPAIFLRP